MRRAVLLLPLFLFACDDTVFEGGAEPVEGDGYEAVVAIADARCVGCHSVSQAQGLDLESDVHAAVVGVTGNYGFTIVEPGDLDNSMFYLKTTNRHDDGDGTDMPPGSGGLSAEENEIIANWILDGAPAE